MRKILQFILILLLSCQVAWAGVDFDATTDYVSGGDITILDNNATWTISFWIYFDSLNLDRSVLGKWGGVGTEQSFLTSISSTNNDEMTVATYNGSYRVETTTNLDLSTGAWINIIWTFDNTAGVTSTIYKNGSSVSDSVSSGANVSPSNSTSSFTVGYEYDSPRSAFDGKMTEVAIWDVVLSQAEINQIALSKVKGMPLQVQESNLLLYWPLDECSEGLTTCSAAGFFKDLSGGGLNGTIVNTPTGQAEGALTYP